MLRPSSHKPALYDLSQACAYIAAGVADWLGQRIGQDGHAALVLTGGKSITHFFESFRKIDLDWGQVNVFLTDDRMVPDGHPASNETQLKTLFLDSPEIAARPHYISIKSAQEPDSEALASAVVILSMGADGHVASLFSRDDLQGDGCLTHVSRPDYDRVSLSYAALQATGKKYIIVYGDQKIDFFRKINMDEFYLRELFLSAEIILVTG